MHKMQLQYTLRCRADGGREGCTLVHVTAFQYESSGEAA